MCIDAASQYLFSLCCCKVDRISVVSLLDFYFDLSFRRNFYLRQGGYVSAGFCLSVCQKDNS